jgi:cob(I)alamin adenosyltransferase
MKVYTRTGDKGETSLYTGQRVPKNDPVIDAIGTVDECNTAIGVAISFLPQDAKFSSIKHQLEIIQHALFDLGAALATPRTRASTSKIDKTRFDEEAIDHLEKWIDAMDDKLPKLTTFILPGGTPSGSFLHLARSICRRAERLIIPLHNHAEVSQKILVYLNRLSDYLFVVSRYVNNIAGTAETNWKQHLSKTEES